MLFLRCKVKYRREYIFCSILRWLVLGPLLQPATHLWSKYFEIQDIQHCLGSCMWDCWPGTQRGRRHRFHVGNNLLKFNPVTHSVHLFCLTSHSGTSLLVLVQSPSIFKLAGNYKVYFFIILSFMLIFIKISCIASGGVNYFASQKGWLIWLFLWHHNIVTQTSHGKVENVKGSLHHASTVPWQLLSSCTCN